jgi:DNA repair and recombination protein RAD52
MAGAFSGHLVNNFQANQTRPPFSGGGDQIVTSAAMSFNANMHGASNMFNTSMADSSFSSNQPSFFGSEMSDATTLKIAALQAKLNQKLGPEYISQRPGPGGGPKLTYAEGWKIINLANEVFGFNGWSSNVISLTTDFIDFNEESRRYTVGTTAIIRVTLRDGVYHEDIGYGMLENSKSKGGALDKVRQMEFPCMGVSNNIISAKRKP